MLDNCSRDGSAAAGARRTRRWTRRSSSTRRTGKGANDSQLLRRARGRYALLLNEDSELRAGATLALWRALQEHPRAALAGARLLSPDGRPQAVRVALSLARRRALAGALGLQGRRSSCRAAARRSARSTGASPRRCSCAARRPRRSTTSTPTSSSTPTRSTSRGGCATPAGESLYVPGARAVHHEQLSSDPVGGRARIVELARNRDLYMRKHHSPAAARAVRWLTALGYAERALAALVLPGHSARRYWAHVRATLHPAPRRGAARGRRTAERLAAAGRRSARRGLAVLEVRRRRARRRGP